MAGITFTRGAFVAGTKYSPGDTATVALSLAKQLIGENTAKFTNAAATAPLPKQSQFLEAVTALTGDAPTGLNGYLVEGVDAGRSFQVKLATETAPRTYVVIAKNGETPDADSIIEPPDFHASSNNKLLLRTN